jgi:hypothetical protein
LKTKRAASKDAALFLRLKGISMSVGRYVGARMLRLIKNLLSSLRLGFGKMRAARLQKVRPLLPSEWDLRASKWYDGLIYGIDPLWLSFVQQARVTKARKAGLYLDYEYKPSGVAWDDTTPPSVVQVHSPKPEFDLDTAPQHTSSLNQSRGD